MTEIKQVYKCEVCGNIVEVLHAGSGELVCCGQSMVNQVANTVDAAHEKHVPVIEKSVQGVIVKVGADPHPMTEEHYIEWIELVAEDGLVCRKYLQSGDEPETVFLSLKAKYARIYCNLHGLWKSL